MSSIQEEAYIRDVAAQLISEKKLQTKDMCKEKMETLEKGGEEMKSTVKSFNNKLWAIIVLLVSLLGTVVVRTF